MAGEKLNPRPLLLLPLEELPLEEPESVVPLEEEPESYDPLSAEPESEMVESAVESTSPPVEVVPESELLGPKLGLLL
jgi:hypothetical protein